MAERLISKERVCERTSISPRNLRELVKAGDFPSPVKISAQMHAWVDGEVTAWIDQKIADAGKTTTTKK
jgi:predicted DNA-binding transcriptional regulator AlpA